MPEFRTKGMDFAKLQRILKLGLFGLALILLWSGLNWAQSLYTDWLWLSSMGYEAVFWKTEVTRLGLFIAGALLFLVLAVPNLFAAFWACGRKLPQGGHKLSPQVDNPVNPVRNILLWLSCGVTGLAAALLAAGLAGEWFTVLRFLYQVPFGSLDPIFAKDLSFFVFTLPALDYFRSWLVGLTVVVMIIVAAFYCVNSILRGEFSAFEFKGRVLAHLAALGALLFVLIAMGHWMGRYELLYSTLGTVYGVGYTDHHVRLPAKIFLAQAALFVAGALLIGAKTRNSAFVKWPVVIWIGLYLLLGSLVPGYVQRLKVEPNELHYETEYLANNIAFTRKAFGLGQFESMSHPARGEMDYATVKANQGAILNIRIWNEGPLLQSYNQIQSFGERYDFLAVHTDRYTVDGSLRQVMLAARELSTKKLPGEAQRWVNRHLQFTHGYGVVMSPVTEVQAGGRPDFFIRDMPPVGKIALDRPEVYYGLKSLDYVIVNSRIPEFNHPGPEGPVYTHYQGQGGVLLNSFFRRLIYAWKFKDLNILISEEITPNSRIQYRRTVPQRFSAVAPFLMRDREAYIVVADGRLFWIQDAYTATNRFPYSTPWENAFNYIRNSVKAVVDAYHGSIDFYVYDEDDPLIRTYQAIFPELFKSKNQMPEYLRGHVRYPRDLFTVQTRMLLQYHVEDPVVFYNRQDQWFVPVQTSFGKTEALLPYYIMARLPGQQREEFLLIQPFTPINQHNLIGLLAARMDGDRYGELLLFRFPTDRHVDGPSQAQARIDNDAVISEQLTLWGQGLGQEGFEVMRGSLLVIPIGDSILYAKPVFLRPQTRPETPQDIVNFPELRRIILADSRQVVMHETLDAAISALVEDLPAVEPTLETDARDNQRGTRPFLSP